MKSFKINKYLKLCLEDGSTNIYLNDILFTQCKYVLLNIPIEKITSFDEIESIDDAYEQLDKTLENGNEIISSDVEFWAHCSNLQIWFENDYNSCLLHKNLAFPLLKKLTEVGDLKAKRVFKEEIVRRLESGDPKVIKYLMIEGYLEYLDYENMISSLLRPDEASYIFELNELIAKKIKELSEKIEFREIPDIKLKPAFEGEDREYFTFLVENRRVVDILISGVDDYFFKFYFEEIPDLIGKFTSLRKINLPNNNFKNLPENFENLKLLEEVDLSHNNFHIFPEVLTSLKPLKRLKISSNYIKKIPESIGNLENLEELNLASNSISKIPESIGRLKNLKILNLNSNLLKELPKSFKFLKGLKDLNLYGNDLPKLPDEIGSLDRLEHIIIARNNLYELPSSLLELKKLEVLTIDRNQNKINLLDKLKKKKIVINIL